MTLAELPLVLMLVGLTAYAVLGGADFGAAFWQLGARGEQGGALRQHAYRAMGPVWEANHVWLIFVLVICWTAYPEVFASIFSTLTVPLFIAAIGIILRGTAYAIHAGTAREIERQAVDRIFSISSVLTPFALGTVVGAIAFGRVPVGNAQGDLLSSWLNASSFAIGFLAVATGAYVAAVYLAGDGARAGREDLASAFRTRALGAGVITGAIALVALLVVHSDGGRVGERLLEWPAIAAVAIRGRPLRRFGRSCVRHSRLGARAAARASPRSHRRRGRSRPNGAAGDGRRGGDRCPRPHSFTGAPVRTRAPRTLRRRSRRHRWPRVHLSAAANPHIPLDARSRRRSRRPPAHAHLRRSPSRARHRRPVRLRRARVYRHRWRRDVFLGAIAANPCSDVLNPCLRPAST
jgi:cytochrome bd-type quinol oxidase subunit 2